MKVQIISDFNNGNILCISVAKGKVHDFSLFKRSKVHFSDHIKVLADKGYQGISELHRNSTTPVKRTKNHKFSRDEKQFNSELSKQRIYIEHINRYIKRFRILSGRYRNKRKKFGLRVSLICGIYNFQHSL